MKERWIKASELGEYLYCQRAWWYRLQGIASRNVQELWQGTTDHLQHNRRLNWVLRQRSLAFILIVIAFALLAFQMMQ